MKINFKIPKETRTVFILFMSFQMILRFWSIRLALCRLLNWPAGCRWVASSLDCFVEILCFDDDDDDSNDDRGGSTSKELFILSRNCLCCSSLSSSKTIAIKFDVSSVRLGILYPLNVFYCCFVCSTMARTNANTTPPFRNVHSQRLV